MKPQALAVLLASAGLCAGVAHAASDNSNWYIAPQIGAVITDSKAQSQDGVFGGLKVGKELTKDWDVQLGGSYSSAKGKSQYTQSGDYRQGTMTAEGLYFFSRDTWRPFLLAGLGWGHDSFDYSGVPAKWLPKNFSSSSILTDVGGGVQYAFSDQSSLQFDLRYLMTRPTHNDKSVGTLGNVYLGAAYVYYFGPSVPELVQVPVAEYNPVPVAPVVEAAPVAPPPPPAPVVETPAPVVQAPPPPPPPAPKVVQLRNLRADSLFAPGSAKLSAKAAKEIDSAFAASNLAYGDLSSIKVVGHADRMGKPAANTKLSQQRALAVKDYLVSKGVAPAIITAEGHGADEPVAQCPAKLHGKKLSACLAPDRRIVITGEGKAAGN